MFPRKGALEGGIALVTLCQAVSVPFSVDLIDSYLHLEISLLSISFFR